MRKPNWKVVAAGPLTTICGFVACLNIGAWLWAMIAFRRQPALLGIALLSYGLGLRHAVDADHIAAIDNVTRKLMQSGRRPVTVGLFFALGHSTLVIVVASIVAATSEQLHGLDSARHIGGIISTSVSALFLFAIAASNILILASIYRTHRNVQRGGACTDTGLDLLLADRGFLTRLFRPAFRLVTRSWHMFLLGALFGLGFDTATEIAMFGISATQAADGVGLLSIIVFPALFAAGMLLIDTTDGVMMFGAYEWARARPMRGLYYNMVLTLVSVVVALLVGGIETLGLLGDQVGLTGGLWDGVVALNNNFNLLGAIIIGTFGFFWLCFRVIQKVQRTNPSAVRATGRS
jgi:high-affinity nickel-transport protein